MNNNIPNNINQRAQPINLVNQVQNTTPIQPSQPTTNPVQNPISTPQPINNTIQNPNTTPTPKSVGDTTPKKQKKSHGKTLFILLLLIVIGFMGYYIYNDYQKDLRTKCSPLVPFNNKTRKLDINSTLVVDLYSKVKTNIKEDIAETELNDKMKLYLAYRQIPESKIYESNCNLFDNNAMPSVRCEVGFNPKAFKEETMALEVKKLFGEDIEIQNQNIEIGNSCLGGYQYIAERGEYVGGNCTGTTSTLYNVDKKLVSATVTNDIITLKEKVRYYGSESVDIDRLKNGIYVYKFKLDNNYNYIYIGKTLE